MQNIAMGNDGSAPEYVDGRQSEAALAIQRGTSRLLYHMDYAPLTEITLKGGRRADILALGRKGEVIIVEIKSSLADFRADSKWPDYLEFCDQFFFAVAPDFPVEVLPADQGLILADGHGAEIARPAVEDRLSAARRKQVTLQAVRAAGWRLMRLLDPEAPMGIDI